MPVGAFSDSSIAASAARRRRSLLIALGPTSGHVYPALAFAEAYRNTYPDIEVHFVSAPDGPADALLTRHNGTLDHVAASALARVALHRKFAAASHLLPGICQAHALIKKYNVQLVIGFGGYVSGSVLLAARLHKLPTVIHEANAIAGLANRWLAPIVNEVFLGWPSASDDFPPRHCLPTGTPVRQAIVELASSHREPPTTARAARILVLSGTWGAAFFAQHMPELFASLQQLGAKVEVLHQSEGHDTARLKEAYRTANVEASIVERIGDISGAYRWADVVVTRAGAGTLAEVAIAGLPALLIPLCSAAADHQGANARMYAANGAALLVSEDAWHTPSVAKHVMTLLSDPEAWRSASSAARALAQPDAAERLVAGCERLMAKRW